MFLYSIVLSLYPGYIQYEYNENNYKNNNKIIYKIMKFILLFKLLYYLHNLY